MADLGDPCVADREPSAPSRCCVSVQVTATRGDTACLYDSVTGMAFGPTFSCQYDAERFLEDLREVGERDPRVIPALELARLKDEWEKEYLNA